nr:Hsp33 family molecular chaperone HslO [Oceanococcus sp. HetDA_MAG_MS8]
MSDSGLWRFQYADLPLRGALLQLGPEWAELVAEQGYDATASSWLGQSLLAVGLLSGLAKVAPKLTLQVADVDAMDLLVAQTLRPGALRGMLKPRSLGEQPLVGQGRMVMTWELADQPQRPRQSIVPLVQANLAAAMEDYFRDSEQLQTRFYLHADRHQAFGVVVQRIAGDDADVDDALSVFDRWDLRTLPAQPEQFLAVLLERDIQILDGPQQWMVRCHCDEASLSRIVLSLGADDARALLAEQGHIQAECGYCGKVYTFTPDYVESLFAAQAAEPQPPNTH